MRFGPSTLLALLTLSLVAAGCPSADDDDNDAQVCGDRTRAQVYVEGLQARTESSSLVVSLMSADPAPPNIDTNIWVVEVTDSAGAAVEGCTASTVPWMPDHGHGSSATPSWVEDTETPGRYSLDLRFIMPGYWETTINLDCAGDTSDHVFGFCAEG
jgi:hypothetical protein